MGWLRPAGEPTLTDPLDSSTVLEPVALSRAPLRNADDLRNGPLPRWERLPPPPPSAGRSAYLNQAGQWVPFPVGSYEAGARASEQEMAFHRFSEQARWIFLSGPSGKAGHRWNERGFDGVAIRLEGPFEMRIPDEKSTPGTVRDASALTTNWRQNLERLQAHLRDPQFNGVARINEARQAVDVALRNARQNLPPPANVVREVLHFGVPARVTSALAAQLRSEHAPSSASAPATRTPVGVPRAVAMPPAVVGSRAGAHVVGGAGAVAHFIGPALGTLHEMGRAYRSEAEIKRIEAETADYRMQNPRHGVLVVLQWQQFQGGVAGVPQAVTLISAFPVTGGRTFDEALERFRRTPSMSRGTTSKHHRRLPDEYYWIPPREP
ncbi:MAG: hypothetical protein M3O70_05590 [Actinomycetota bacterium]|nr:hypothetical protein [Actinomycetota bacterium]